MPIQLRRCQGQRLQSHIAAVRRVQMDADKDVQLTGCCPPERRGVGLCRCQHESTAERL